MKFRKLAFMSLIVLFSGSFYACNDDLDEISPDFNPTESQLETETKKNDHRPPS